MMDRVPVSFVFTLLDLHFGRERKEDFANISTKYTLQGLRITLLRIM